MAEEVINAGFSSGAIMVHDGKDINDNAAAVRNVRRKLVTRVIFLLNSKDYEGRRACLPLRQ